MTEKERKEIERYIDLAVERTIRAFKSEGMTKEVDDLAYGSMSLALKQYYGKSGELFSEANGKLNAALDNIVDDLYFSIIPMYFEDGMTIEQIAEAFGVDVSTIVRNKKRLCLKIYAELQ